MKQVVQNFRTGELKVDEIPSPALRPGGVLVRTAFSLISAGTERATVKTGQSSLVGKILERPDLVRQTMQSLKREGLRSTYDKVKSRLNQVKALGYSSSGVVIAVGEAVHEFRVGQFVACAGVGHASHAEEVFVPENLCAAVPDGVPLEAACYATVGAIALHGVRQAEAHIGETVAVIGLGLIGQLTVQILQASGCRVLGIDISNDARELAKKSKADVVCDPPSALDQCMRLTAGRGADCVLITAGTKSNEPIELAADIARDRAKIVAVGLVGLDLPRDKFYVKELELRLSRSYGPGRYDPDYEDRGNDYPIGYVRWTEKRNLEAFLRLLAEGRIDASLLTTHRYTIENAVQAYQLILGEHSAEDGYRCGVVLEYPQTEVRRERVISAMPARQTASDEVGISFIGAGNFARGVLIPILRSAANVRLRGVATATGVSAKNTQEQFRFAYATTHRDQILDDPTTDCVVIATRHDLHASLAAEAMRRGKAVFVEKPLALNHTGLREVLLTARETGRLLMVGYNRRFSTLAREVKRRLADRSGALAILYRISAGRLPEDHWSLGDAEGGGRIIGEVCHFIDFVQHLTDSVPASLYAAAVPGDQAAGFVDDSLSISIAMEDGSVASILYSASGDAAVAKERIEVFCDGATAIIEDFKSGEFIRGGHRTRLGRGSQDKGHRAELEAFLCAVRGNGESPITLESLAATSAASFAIVESLKSGCSTKVDVGHGLLVDREQLDEVN